MNELNAIVDSARAAFGQAVTPADLENAKAVYLGKSGRITEMMKGLAALAVDEKKAKRFMVIDDRTRYGQDLAEEFGFTVSSILERVL